MAEIIVIAFVFWCVTHKPYTAYVLKEDAHLYEQVEEKGENEGS